MVARGKTGLEQERAGDKGGERWRVRATMRIEGLGEQVEEYALMERVVDHALIERERLALGL